MTLAADGQLDAILVGMGNDPHDILNRARFHEGTGHSIDGMTVVGRSGATCRNVNEIVTIELGEFLDP